MNVDRLIGHEFWLDCRNRLARPAVRQLICRPYAVGFFADVRYHHLLHKPFDKRRLPGAHRTDHPEVNIPSRSFRNIFEDIDFFHENPSFNGSVTMINGLSPVRKGRSPPLRCSRTIFGHYKYMRSFSLYDTGQKKEPLFAAE